MVRLATLKLRSWVCVIAVTLLGALALYYLAVSHRHPRLRQHETTGDVEVIHSTVLVRGESIRGTGRVGPGDHVVTEVSGRARLRLVEGVTALLDGASTAKVHGGKLELISGRLFVDSPEGRRIALAVAGATAQLAGSKVSVEFLPKNGGFSLYCAQGEVVVALNGKQLRVESGETLRQDRETVSVEPEKAFDDWTLGLAVPWQSHKQSRSSLPEVWAYEDNGEPEARLAVSREDIDITLEGEFAVTRTKTVYFNGHDRSVRPKLRVSLPSEALLSKVIYDRGPGTPAGDATLALCDGPFQGTTQQAVLEWGGNGWVVGQLPNVPPGESLALTLEYAEWLRISSGRATYRQPFAKGEDAPIIGEMTVTLNAEKIRSELLEVNQGALRKDSKYVWHSADTRPSDDWVTSYVPSVCVPNSARAYVETVRGGSDPYVMVRLETPQKSDAAIRLALVVDVSQSVGAQGLELARTMVEAIVGNLSPKDSAIVIAADEERRTVLRDQPTSVTAAFGKELAAELSKLRSGGASDIGGALEYAADKLDGADDSQGYNNAIVYLGDGKPSLGDLQMEQIRGRLSRRAAGTPRLSTVALGGSADLWQLARLVSSAGEVYRAVDRADAASVASQLVSMLERPSYSGTRVELGTTIDRLYPREGRHAQAGSTIVAVGRLRGQLPRTVQLSYFDAGKQKRLSYPLHQIALPEGADVARRWGEQRVFELAAGTEEMQSALQLAKTYQLLTPWTGWFFDNPAGTSANACSALDRRLVELSTLNDTPYAHRIAPRVSVGSGWLEPPKSYDAQQSIEDAVRLNARASIEKAKPAMAACRDARQSQGRPLPAVFDYQLSLAANGSVDKLAVNNASGQPSDAPLARCIERVIRGVTYQAAGRPCAVTGSVRLPSEMPRKRSRCSSAAKLPLEQRSGVWSSRSGAPVVRYSQALANCELPTWIDRRTLLDLLLQTEQSVSARLAVVQGLRDAGYSDAAAYCEHATMERITSLDELELARRVLLKDEPNIDAIIAAQVAKNNSDEERLKTVTLGLRLAPHSALGRRLLLLLLENLGESAELVRKSEAIRSDPFADAGLVALSAAALGRMGHERESRRNYNELFERAPFDPWVLAFAGDQLRRVGLSDDAIVAYESLSKINPDESSTLLRLGLAQAAAGRVDIASRLLDRAAQIGGRGNEERLHELSAVVRAVTLCQAREQSRDEKERAELTRRLVETALPEMAAILLIEVASTTEDQVDVRSFGGKDDLAKAPELDAEALGLYGIHAEVGATQMKIALTRRLTAGLGRPLPFKIHILRRLGEQGDYRLTTKQLAFAKDSAKAEANLSEDLRP